MLCTWRGAGTRQPAGVLGVLTATLLTAAALLRGSCRPPGSLRPLGKLQSPGWKEQQALRNDSKFTKMLSVSF